MMDVMIDVETFGNEPGFVVISVGAYVFDPFGKPLPDEAPVCDWGFDPADPAFMGNISWASATDLGLRVDGDTLRWWILPPGEEPSAKAFESVIRDQKPLPKTLHQLNGFLARHGIHNVWAKDPNFDCAMLDACYKVCHVDKLWDYEQERSVRTMRWLALEAGMILPEPVGVPHNPLHDAFNQVREVMCVVEQLHLR
jgi:hypothetical protein